MEFPERVSERLTAVISDQLEYLSEQKLAEIKYGIAVFITNSYKMLLLFIIAILLNIFKYFVIALVSFGALRTFASGVHAKREWTCLFTSMLIFFGAAYLGMIVHFNIYMLSIIFALCFAAVLRYAPAGTEERPIVSSKLRRKLKIMSCTTVAVLYATAVYSLDTPASSIIAFSALIEALTIMPITYKLTGSVFGVGISINNEREV